MMIHRSEKPTQKLHMIRPKIRVSIDIGAKKHPPSCPLARIA